MVAKRQCHRVYCGVFRVVHSVYRREAEAMFWFVDGLSANVQVWVHTQKPVDLQSAMQMAE